MSNITWGLERDITPHLGVRLVQEGNRLHYLADRASITGKFSDAECLKLDEAFPHFISQMESMLTTGEMNPRHAHCVTLYHNGFTCEADCVFRSIRSRIGIEVRSAIRLHSINRELNFSYCFLTCFFVAFHCRFIFPH